MQEAEPRWGDTSLVALHEGAVIGWTLGKTVFFFPLRIYIFWSGDVNVDIFLSGLNIFGN